MLERGETAWFDVISTGTQQIGGANVIDVGGGGKDDGRNDSPFRVGFEVFKHSKAVGAWHFDVRHDEGGVSILSAVGVWPLAHHVGDGFFAIAEEVNGAGNANFPEGHLNELPVSRLILDDQNSV